MKRILTHLLTAIVAVLMVGCGGGGSGGSAPPAPTGVSAVAGDATVTVTWTQEGFTYWVWSVISNAISILGCSTCSTNTSNASSPFVATSFAQGGWLTNAGTPSLINSAHYTFTVNAHSGDSPGSTAASSVTVVPRLAGGTGTWNVVSAVNGGIPTLTSLDFGAPATALTAASAVGSTGMFVASDSNGTMWWTNMTATSGGFNPATDGFSGTWTQGTATGSQLNAVAYNANGYFVAVGNGGKIWRSIDGMGWAQQTSPTGNALNAIISNGGTEFITVGAAGTALYSSGSGTTWTAATSGTANALNAIATNGSGTFVAVGASGTMIYSTTGSTWSACTITGGTGAPLVGVAYGTLLSNYIQTNYPTTTVPAENPVWAAVGSDGTLLTSPDGINWTQQAANSIAAAGPVFNGLAYGHQFIAIDSTGNAYTSVSGVSGAWTTVATGAGAVSLKAIKPFTVLGGQYAGQYIYGVVGASGTVMIAR